MRDAQDICLGKAIVKSRSLPATMVDGDLVMVDLDGGAYLALDPVGQRIWRLLDEPKTLAELCDLLQAEYAVDADQCRADVNAFLMQLQTSKLVRFE